MTLVEEAGPARRAFARLRRNRAAMAGAWTLFGIVLLCFGLPAALGLDAQSTDPVRHLQPPGPGAWLGRDSLGRDYLARVFVGGQTSLLIGLVATLASVTIGVFYGMVAGYYGGRFDEAMMRLVDFLYGLPYMFLVILIMLLFSETPALVPPWDAFPIHDT